MPTRLIQFCMGNLYIQNWWPRVQLLVPPNSRSYYWVTCPAFTHFFIFGQNCGTLGGRKEGNLPGVLGSNPGQLHERQAPYLLHHLSSPSPKFFIDYLIDNVNMSMCLFHTEHQLPSKALWLNIKHMWHYFQASDRSKSLN